MPEENNEGQEGQEGTEASGSGGEGKGGEGKGGESKPKQVTLAQEDMSKIMAREKQEGNSAGRKKLLKDLGVDSEEEAQAIVKAHRDASEAAKTELQRQNDAAAKAAKDAESEKVEARKDRFGARAEAALLGAGVNENVVDRAAKLLDVSWDPRTDEVPDKEVIKGAVDSLKKDVPSLFKKASGNGEGNVDSDTGGSGKGGRKVEGTASERAAQRLARTHPTKVTKE